MILIFGALSMLPGVRGEWWAPAQGVAAGFAIAFMVAAIIVVALAIRAMGRRRNWGRWLLLIYAVVDVLSTISTAPHALSVTPFGALLDMLSAPAEVWACVLVFRGPGAAWFRD